MTNADRELMELTARVTVEKAIEKIIPIVDERIESHQNACYAKRLENEKKAKASFLFWLIPVLVSIGLIVLDKLWKV